MWVELDARVGGVRAHTRSGMVPPVGVPHKEAILKMDTSHHATPKENNYSLFLASWVTERESQIELQWKEQQGEGGRRLL